MSLIDVEKKFASNFVVRAYYMENNSVYMSHNKHENESNNSSSNKSWQPMELILRVVST